MDGCLAVLKSNEPNLISKNALSDEDCTCLIYPLLTLTLSNVRLYGIISNHPPSNSKRLKLEFGMIVEPDYGLDYRSVWRRAYILITHSKSFQCERDTGLRLELAQCVKELNDWELEWVT